MKHKKPLPQELQKVAAALSQGQLKRVMEASRRIEHLDSAKDYGYEAEGAKQALAAVTAPPVSCSRWPHTACLQKHLWFSGQCSSAVARNGLRGVCSLCLTLLVCAAAIPVCQPCSTCRAHAPLPPTPGPPPTTALPGCFLPAPQLRCAPPSC